MLIEKILGVLQAGAETTADLIDIFTSDYASSYRKMKRSISRGPRPFNANWAEAYRETQRFYSLMNYLKQQGFVESKKVGRPSLWKITSRGIQKHRDLKRRNQVQKSSAHYESADDGKLKIVIFDVPEREREKRLWIRTALLSLGFTLLQKSVWMGERKIPQEFLEDAREKKLMRCLHIFEVSKAGTVPVG